ncbi:unnamed protein product [Urochloa humidicola]
MAALRPCPSGSGLVVAASQLSFITLPPLSIQPSGRRGSALLLSLNTSTGKTGHHRHAIGARKGAEEGFNLDPEDKKRVIEEQVKKYRELFAKHYELEKVRVTPIL